MGTMGTITSLFLIGAAIFVVFTVFLVFKRSAPDRISVEQRFTAQVESHWRPRIRRTEKAESRAAKRIEKGTFRSERSANRAARRYLKLQNKARNLRTDMSKDVQYHLKSARNQRIGPDGRPMGGIGRYGTAHKGMTSLPQTSKDRKREARAGKSIRITGRAERKRQRKNGS